MRKREKEIVRYFGPWVNHDKTTVLPVRGSNFLLSYPFIDWVKELPIGLVPDNELDDVDFWKNWYIDKLSSIEILSDRKIDVNVCWLNGALRCDWSINPQVRLCISTFNMRFEEFCSQPYSHIKTVFICSPEVITDSSAGDNLSVTTPERPSSNKILSKLKSSHIILDYSSIPTEFVDYLFLDDSSNKRSCGQIKYFFKSDYGWHENLNLEFKSIIISRNDHKDGKSSLSVYTNLGRLPRNIDKHSFDIWTGSYWAHPNVVTREYIPEEIIDYMLRYTDFIADTHLLIPDTQGSGPQYFSTDSYVRYIAETEGLEKARSWYMNVDHNEYRAKWVKIKPQLEVLRESYLGTLIDSTQSRFHKHGPEFPDIPNNHNYTVLFDWFNQLNCIEDWWGGSLKDTIPCSLILLGPANIGKEEFVRANLHKFISEGTVVWAQTNNDLDRIDAFRTKIIVFDNIKWQLKGAFAENEYSASRLLSTIENRTIERSSRRKGYFLPERTVVIILSNLDSLPNFMGGNMHTENSRKLTDKEEAYIIANPDLYIKRIGSENLNNLNPKAEKYKTYKLEDLPPEKHIEAGYCDEPALHYVPLDIYPKRTHILRFSKEDILFDPERII